MSLTIEKKTMKIYYKYDRVELYLKNEKIDTIKNLKNINNPNDFSPVFKKTETAKIYLLKNADFYQYVGATTQPIDKKLKQGLRGNAKYGYHGYKWKNQEIIECFVWIFNGFTKKQMEAVEAELVFQIRSKYRRWPEYQNEIHFNNHFELGKDISKEIFNYLESTYPLKTNFGYKRNTKYIFEEPYNYGLRGDPYLWKDLKARYEYSDIMDLEKFKELLISTFKENTGNLPIKEERYFVKHFNFGGMSSGYISADFWIEKGFPLLEERFSKMKRH